MSPVTPSDTIYALSSGRLLPAAIAVVRVSGPRAGTALGALAGKVPAPRQAMLARLRDASGEALDDALVLWFPGPRSETGEDTAEFHLHGGRAVVAAVYAALGSIAGLRPAEPGEFTRRAFANGKLDLTRVEGLADLLGAETEAQRRQALRQLGGLLGNHAERWRARLIEALALVEALIDFPDEDDVGPELLAPAIAIATELATEIRTQLASARRGERLRDGLTVAIAGPVNVGKSSILNVLAKRPAAIVSPFAGTTRDVIEVHLDLGGFPVTVLDTAGLRPSADPIEQEGMRRATERAEEADLVLWVADATDPTTTTTPVFARPDAPAIWTVLNKCDLTEECGPKDKSNSAEDRPLHPPPRSGGGGPREARWRGPSSSPSAGLAAEGLPAVRHLSAKTGVGFEALTEALAEYAAQFFGSNEAFLITRERHRSLLASCASSLDRAVNEGRTGHDDLVAEELRLAARDLGRLTGRVDVEDVLDVIFRDFCVGK